jgi:hypothetical protein
MVRRFILSVRSFAFLAFERKLIAWNYDGTTWSFFGVLGRLESSTSLDSDVS